jgi:hypothetical protein
MTFPVLRRTCDYFHALGELIGADKADGKKKHLQMIA